MIYKAIKDTVDVILSDPLFQEGCLIHICKSLYE